MPTTDAPQYYERSVGIAAGHADPFLKSIDPDYYEAETGNVESPLGHVALVNITRDMIAAWVSSDGDPWMSEVRNFSPGWYIIRTNEHGIVWGIEYGPDSTLAEEKARADFAEAERVYAEWDGLGMVEDDHHNFGLEPVRGMEDAVPLFVFTSDTGQKLGIQLDYETGNIQIGGWNEDGEWVDLTPRRQCQPACKTAGHTSAFPLDQHPADL